MADYENILLDVNGAVATITLNRPEKLNAISPGLQSDLTDCLRELRPGDAVRVIRLKAAGRAFCAGYDITPAAPTWQPNQRSGDGAAEQGESRISLDRENLREIIDGWLWMWSYRKPIVAQVHGYCLAGGGDIIGACDIVFAAKDARFGHPAGRALGIPTAAGFWPFRIGMLKSKELLFTGDMIDGVEAKEIGMVNHAVDEAQLDQTVVDYCNRVSQVPLDLLTVHKHTTNRWFELAGLRTAAYESGDFDAIAHESPTRTEWHNIAEAEGLKQALAWRDGPFGDGRGAKRPTSE